MSFAGKWNEYREELRLTKPRLSEYKIKQLQAAFYAGAEAALIESDAANARASRIHSEIDTFKKLGDREGK